MAEIETLEIPGYRGEAVPNVFFQAPKDTAHLGVLLPGFGYTAQAPALYFSRILLLQHGADVLQVNYNYQHDPRFNLRDEALFYPWIEADARAALQAGLARRTYERVTLIGKSLGTLALGCLVEAEELRVDDCIWMTPILSNERLRSQISLCKQRGLVIIGDEDHYYDEKTLEELERVTGNPTLVIPGADHALELPGKAVESVQAVEYIVEALDTFLWA